MPTDKQNVEFIWAIVKQLEVKHVDWSTVASANSISNGHAARMRFHRLRQAMEGVATKHRTPKIDEPSEKSKGKDKHGSKMPILRKAKYLALKRKLAAISDDEEEPVAHVKARMRMKRELEDDSEDDYVDSETEEERAVLKRIKREEATERIQDERSVSPTTVKAEIEECPIALSSRRKSMPEKIEVMEDDVATLEPKPKPIKDKAVEEDGAIMIESPPTSSDDVRIKQEVFEMLVEV